uniref:Uncharacterized protein n=1 Tax=Arundo donax TaxID=35708 RepID=A0A0A9F0L8_ARUDO
MKERMLPHPVHIKSLIQNRLRLQRNTLLCVIHRITCQEENRGVVNI